MEARMKSAANVPDVMHGDPAPLQGDSRRWRRPAPARAGPPARQPDQRLQPVRLRRDQPAKKHGETDERLHNVAAWRETPFFTEEERAALALTEAATRIQDGAPGVTDEIWDAAAAHFDESSCPRSSWRSR